MTITTHPILYIGIWFVIIALTAYTIDRFILKSKRSVADKTIMFLLAVTILVWGLRW